MDAAKFSADHFQNRTDAPVEIITLYFRQMLAHAIRVNLLNPSFPCLQRDRFTTAANRLHQCIQQGLLQGRDSQPATR